ncbi:MAG: hypothetical protein HOP13_02155 [Alphaproteobacteria bacterium]|nr:hypothetical protein [Alphaproteobacteria bacterium]
MALDIVFVPHLPLGWILILTVASVALVGASLLLRAPGAWWRAGAMAAALLVLANPAIVEEERKGLPDVAVIVADQTQSQAIGDRSKTVDDTVAKLRAKLAAHKDLDVRVITVTEDRSVQDGGTSLFGPLADAFADVPPDRIAGAVLVTDGQIHDVPSGAAAKLTYPVHALLTGEPNERDRKLTIEQAPRYGIVGEPLTFTVRVDDFGTTGEAVADLEVRIDGKVVLNETARTGEPKSLELTLPHGGENVIEIQAGAGPKELTLLNNRAAVVTTGIRDQLRVLLVSGEPHAGERTLRNLLKADPSVSLVHFTILRPPEKQDGTPVDELSLIAFPTRELFDEKLNDFNLIIFDRYQRRGVLPLAYYENVARYVENGGALLITSGPEFSSPLSLYRSPLNSVIPAEPVERIYEQGYKPRLTEAGERHPVTAGLPGANVGNKDPTWGRWFRLVQAQVLTGQTLMQGAEQQPLLVLNRVQEGRVALLLSDHAWLWTRGFEGGGPQAELLRRLAHWLMKEPELEEERLNGTIKGDRLIVTRRTMAERAAAIEVTHPSGRAEKVTLTPTEDGAFSGTIKAPEMGLYRLRDGNLSAVAAAGPLNPRELSDVRATEKLVKLVTHATKGGIAWIKRDGLPEIRRTRPGRAASDDGWIGLRANEAYAVRSTRQTPLFHPAIAFVLIIGSLMLGWRREGR